jgi:hypothetical protein
VLRTAAIGDGRAVRVSDFGENWTEGEELELGFVVELLYGARECLVTTPSSGRSPASEKDGHAVVLSSMHVGEDEDELLSSVLIEGVRLACWAGAWAVLLGCRGGLDHGLRCWALLAR